jgi:DNA-binding LacI/PurR family transcriptional regulator
MEDVAARAGVSRALVSIVFRGAPGASEETRQRVLATAADLGYQPDRRASRLGRSRTRMVGVVLSLGHEFHGEVADGIYAAAEARGYEVVLSGVTRRRSEADAVRAVIAERCEGAILLGPNGAASSLAEWAKRMPTVIALRQVRNPHLDVVRTDDAEGLRLAVEHLHALGHRRVAHVDGGRAAGAAQRRRGFREAAQRLGLAPLVMPGGLDEEAGAHAGRLLLDLAPDTRPTAVAAFNDRCALGLLETLRQGGLTVPGEVSVIGFDDIPAAGYAHIALTTVRQDADRLGRLALERLDRRLGDDADTVALPADVVPPSLVRRATTTPPA